MQRRRFLKTAGLGAAAATTLAAPAIAQSGEIRWRLATSWPKSLDTLHGGAEHMAKRVHDLTGGKFQIRVFAGGEIVPALQVLDAVQANTVEMAHTASYYFFGKDPSFALDCAVPFGLNCRQQNAWMTFGGGRDLVNEFFKDYSTYTIPCGNTGAQMGGWFRKEVKTVADMQGVKYRIGGYGGRVMAKIGVVPQQIAGGDIYPALEKGTIDAAEWVGPYDDEKLGFNKVAKYYYYPGWWEGGTQVSAYVNLGQWNGLSAENKAIVEAACAEANTWMMAKYDAQNPAALRRLVAGGAVLRPFSREIMQACLNAANELNDEVSDTNPRFKKIYDSYRRFRAEALDWFRVSEATYDSFMQANRGSMPAVQRKKT
jgi:TRAP-type mannitol/chloroaromatic compound transport system substrate-binding protein